MKSPFFLRLPISWAVGDSSVGALFGKNGKQADTTTPLNKYYPLLLVASAGMLYLLVKAEDNGNWIAAQASLITVLALLALTVWCWWQTNNVRSFDLSRSRLPSIIGRWRRYCGAWPLASWRWLQLLLGPNIGWKEL